MTYQEIFKTVYRQTAGIPFLQMNGKEGKCLKELYNLIPIFWKEYKDLDLDEEQQLRGFEHFLNSVEDEFVLSTFTPSVLLGCFNSLAQQAYGNHKKKNRTISFKFDLPTEQEMKEIQLIKDGYERLKRKD